MHPIVKFWKKLGPGLVTGASDDDPSGIATYSQAGAMFGLLTLWTALVTYPLMFYLQEMCARIGIVTNQGLGSIIKKHYPKQLLWVLIIFFFPAVTFNIAANLAGMGAVTHLLVPFMPVWCYTSIFTVLLLIGLLFFSYKKMSFILKWLCLSLLVYLIVPFLVKENWQDILWATITPTIKFSKEYLLILVAILGTTISPYLFFWQASMSVEDRNHKPDKILKKEIKDMKLDVQIGMFLSNLVMFFIILTTGTVLHNEGILHIETVQDAAKALEPLAGHFAYLLFALGVIGTGMLSIPILAGCLGYLFADIFDWEKGMDKKITEAKKFYAVMIASILLGFFINTFELDPIRALIFTSIIYGLLAPFLIILIMHICNRKDIMKHLTNSWVSNLMGTLAFLLMSGAAFFLIYFI